VDDGLSTLEVILGAVTAGVALYAAVVGTVSLVLQRRDKRQREEARCEVKVGLYQTVDQAPIDPVALEGQLNRIVNVVGVSLINRSEYAVRWMGVAFHKQGGGPDDFLMPIGYAYPPTLPLKVTSRDSGDVMLDRGKLEEAGIDWTKPVLVRAWLSTGETFHSEERPLA
jgi:hypothetical protein